MRLTRDPRFLDDIKVLVDQLGIISRNLQLFLSENTYKGFEE